MNKMQMKFCRREVSRFLAKIFVAKIPHFKIYSGNLKLSILETLKGVLKAKVLV